MKGLRLYKKERLCQTTAIDRLFARGSGASAAIAFPLRAVWLTGVHRPSDAPVAFVISVPKKRLRHAVDRVTMRRRIREAYRLCRPGHPMPADARVNVAFIYVADRLTPYAAVNRAVNRLMDHITASLHDNDTAAVTT